MYIGIDLGGTNIAIGLVNEEGKVVAKDSAEREVFVKRFKKQTEKYQRNASLWNKI